MKNRNIIQLFAIIVIALGMSSSTVAQDIIQMSCGSETINIVGGEVFFDAGGAAANYPNDNCVSETIFCASSPGQTVTIDFVAFETFLNFDWFVMYDGNAPITATNGASTVTNPSSTDPELFTSHLTNPSGAYADDLMLMMSAYGTTSFTSTGQCLTTAFRTSSVSNFQGWEANLSVNGGSTPPGGGGGGTAECVLVCSGDQEYTLGGGECTIELPNLVTIAGNCDDLVTGDQILLFTDVYDPTNYADFVAGGVFNAPSQLVNGFLTDLTNVPDEITLTSFDGGVACAGSIINFAPAPFDGTLSFDYDYSSLDGLGWDPFSYAINWDGFVNSCGTFNSGQLNNGTTIGAFGTGTVSIPVVAGDVLTLATITADGFAGASTAVISNFLLDGGLSVASFSLEQTRGPVAGDNLVPGSYNLGFNLIDPSGMIADSCSFDVTVNPFPNPSASLSCNGQINISVDNMCEVTFNADQFLEGSNYGCFDSLEIFVLPYGNPQARTGNVNGVTLDFSNLLADQNNPHQYEIRDPATGNLCWGDFIVEDKIAPVVDCPCAGPQPIAEFTGVLDANSPIFARPGTNAVGWTGACATGGVGIDHVYDANTTFLVSQTDIYTFTSVSPDGEGQAIYIGQPDMADPCIGLVASLAFGTVFTVELQAGIEYTYVLFDNGSFSPGAGAWTTTFTSLNGGTILGDDASCIFSCFEVDAILGSTAATLNPDLASGDNCGVASSTFTDAVVGSGCGPSQILRSWVFTDQSGNASTCTQVFTFNNITVADLLLPPATVTLDCGVGTSPAEIAAFFDEDSRRTSSLVDDDYTETPNIIELNEGIRFAYPYYQVVGFDGNLHDQPVDNAVCQLIADYTDISIDACGVGCFGNSKIIREWTILDWCEQSTTNYTQIIKATDNSEPTFFTKDTTVSTRPWDCTAQFELPGVWELHDACDYSPIWYATGPVGVTITGNSTDGYTVSGAPKGVHTFTYYAEDCCGNIATRTSTITVIDAVAPVVSTKQDIVVALTPAGPGFESTSKIFVQQVNNFSYDACTDVYVEIRRSAGAPDCGNIGIDDYNNNVTFNNAVPTLHNDDNRNDTDNGQFVKVCCEDLALATVDVNGDGVLDPGYIEIVVRVWDDANMTGVFGDVDQTGFSDNYNEAWSYAKVEDNLPPAISCPADATIECYWAIDVSSDFGAGFQSVDLADFEKTGVASAYSTCQLENVEFSDRLSLDDCGIGTITRTFRSTKNDKNGNPVTAQCRQIITVSDEYQSTFDITPPNPRVTTVSTCGLMQSDLDSNKPTVVGGICDVIGENVKVDTFLFEGGVCKKWVAEYNYTNWCTGEDMGPFFAEFIYEDTEAPIIECVDTCLGVDANCSYTYVFDKSAVDTSGCVQNGWLKWFVTFDAWADGTVDYAVSSFAPANYTTWRVDEALSAQYNVPLTTLWLHTPGTASGEAFTQRNGQPVSIPEDLGGQMSNHKITYKVTDGCHNFASCTEDVMIADKKAPTPYCVSLSTALMQDPDGNGPLGPMVELWACDFNRGAFDNCTAQENLYLTFNQIPFVVDTLIRVGQAFLPVNATIPHYFDANGFVDFDGDGGVYPLARAATLARYNRGDIQKWFPDTNCSGIVFTDADLPQASVEVSVWDQKLNTDYCDVFLTLRIASVTGTRTVQGMVATAMGESVESVAVTLDAGSESDLLMTTGTGVFASDFDMNDNVTVTAKRDGDDDNGLSTLDIVLIQRHILNIAPFSSAYSVFASDVNRSASVSGADVVELRKLILGVTSEFASTDSWRFIDGSQSLFADDAFSAKEFVYSAAGTLGASNLVAVKMGDVNNSADAAEVRSGKSVIVSFEDATVAAGDLSEVTLSTADYTNAYGFQFTLDVEGLEIVEVRGADLDFDDANYAILDATTATVSYASIDAESVNSMITLVVRATRGGNLSSMISINSDVTAAEAYLGGNFDIASVELVARGAAAYELFQNEPNPFQAVTMIGWNMAEAGTATLTVFDIAGRVLKSITSDCTAGYNSIDMTSDELGTTGVLYYQIEAGDFTATKKMILID